MVRAAGTEVNTGARIISHSDHLRSSSGITASIGCNKCSCNRIFISTGTRSIASVVVIDTAPQASVAVGVPNDGVSGHSMVAAAGTEVNTGAVLSVTVITCEAVAVLPQASVAINVLVTVYSLAQVPGVLHHVDVIDNSTTGISCSWCTKRWSERTLDGCCCRHRSKYRCRIIVTVITCEAVAVLPQASVAINVLVSVYSLAQVPGAVASVVVMITAPQASVAVGVPNDGVSGHSMVPAAGTEVNTGAVLSSQ